MKNTYRFIAYAFILMTAVLPVVSHANASPIVKYCERQYELNNFGPMTNYTRKKCGLLFEKWTWEWTTGLYSNLK